MQSRWRAAVQRCEWMAVVAVQCTVRGRLMDGRSRSVGWRRSGSLLLLFLLQPAAHAARDEPTDRRDKGENNRKRHQSANST